MTVQQVESGLGMTDAERWLAAARRQVTSDMEASVATTTTDRYRGKRMRVGISSTTGRVLRTSQTFVADGSSYYSRPGPRLVDTLEIIASTVHPGVCGAAYPDRGLVRVYE